MHKTQYLLITLLLVWSCGGDPVEQADFPYVYEYEGTSEVETNIYRVTENGVELISDPNKAYFLAEIGLEEQSIFDYVQEESAEEFLQTISFSDADSVRIIAKDPEYYDLTFAWQAFDDKVGLFGEQGMLDDFFFRGAAGETTLYWDSFISWFYYYEEQFGRREISFLDVESYPGLEYNTAEELADYKKETFYRKEHLQVGDTIVVITGAFEYQLQ